MGILSPHFQGSAGLRIYHNTFNNRIEVSLTAENIMMTISDRISGVLGFPPNFDFVQSDIEFVGTYSPDLRAGLYNGFMYTNIIENQLVGDTSAPLLRVFNLGGE